MEFTPQQLEEAVATLWDGTAPTQLASTGRDKPMYGLKIADERLQKVGILAGPETTETIARQHQDLENADKEAAWLKAILHELRGSLGPLQDARAGMWSWARRALDQKYKLADPRVKGAFSEFLKAVATDGWEGLNTTGTTIGNATHANTDSMGKFFSGK